MPRVALLAVAALAAPSLALGQRVTGAAPWRVEPEVGLTFSLARESLSVRGASNGESLRDPSALPAVTLGLRHALWGRRVWLHSALLLGLSTQAARGVVGLEEQALVHLDLSRLVGLGVGVGLRAALDLASPSYSLGVASVALALRVWRFEVVWAPGLQAPLGASRRDATGVEVTQQMALRVEPLSFALRFDVGPRP